MSTENYEMSQPLPKRILIIAIRAIGDIVLITPLLPLLKKRFPTSYLALLADGPSAQIFENNPHLDQLFIIDRSSSNQLPWLARVQLWVKLVSMLRRQNFDIVVDLFSGPRSAILGYISKARDRYGEDFRKRGRGLFYNHPISISRDGRHIVEQKLDLIQPLIGKVEPKGSGLELYLTDEEKRTIKPLLCLPEKKWHRMIGLVPSAGSIWRVWPPKRFAELADALVETYGAEIVLLGGKSDHPVCQRICDFMTNTPLDLSGKTTLRELMAVMAELDLVISNVTGPLHVASAFPKPKVIGLYGAADTVQYAPWGANVTMLTKGTPGDAFWNNVDYQRDYDFLLQITVADVLKTVRSVMQEWSRADEALLKKNV